MGNKRFTDKSKWRNEWFRTLPLKAKTAWTYLCDECDFCGVWKIDLGLASFQMDFAVTKENLVAWFGDKIHFFGNDNLLIVGFYEFQYGDAKDSWTAKEKAKLRLEKYGFIVKENKVFIENRNHGAPTVADRGPLVLIEGDIVVEGEVVNKGGLGEKFVLKENDLFTLYNMYPLKKGKQKGFDKIKREIKNEDDLGFLITAIRRYKSDVERNKTDPKYIKHFSTFMSEWRDWTDPETGSSAISKSKRADLSHLWPEETT